MPKVSFGHRFQPLDPSLDLNYEHREYIEELLDDEECAYAYDTLKSIHDYGCAKGYITQAQLQACRNIEAGAEKYVEHRDEAGFDRDDW